MGRWQGARTNPELSADGYQVAGGEDIPRILCSWVSGGKGQGHTPNSLLMGIRWQGARTNPELSADGYQVVGGEDIPRILC